MPEPSDPDTAGLVWCNVCQRYVGNLDHLCVPRRTPDTLTWTEYKELHDV